MWPSRYFPNNYWSPHYWERAVFSVGVPGCVHLSQDAVDIASFQNLMSLNLHSPTVTMLTNSIALSSFSNDVSITLDPC